MNDHEHIAVVNAGNRDKLRLGYVVGQSYHTTYWHYDFKVLAYDPDGAVIILVTAGDLAGELRKHMTSRNKDHVVPGQCPRQRHGYDCLGESARGRSQQY